MAGEIPNVGPSSGASTVPSFGAGSGGATTQPATPSASPSLPELQGASEANRMPTS